MTYLDWAATTPPDSAILAEAAALAADCFGNPSSKHGLGSQAKAKLEEARALLSAALFGAGAAGRESAAPPGAKGRISFTGGGTEGDAIPLLALLRSALNAKRDGSIKRLHLVVTEIEHAAVYEQAQLLKSLGLGVTFVSPGLDGRVDPQEIAAAVEKDSALVAVMAVNNETGAVQPIAEIGAAIAKAAAALGRSPPRLHCDAVQALGKVELPLGAPGLGSMAFSAHKIRGPRGAGALWTATAIEPLAVGGGQESGQRPGTESLQGAWAFANAASAALSKAAEGRDHARALEARLFAGLKALPGALVLPEGRSAGDGRYSPYIVSIAFPGLTGEVLARALSDEGVAVSTGSACSSNSKRAGRRVLMAMGVGEELSLSAIRVSTGESSTEGDIDRFLEAASSAYRKLKT